MLVDEDSEETGGVIGSFFSKVLAPSANETPKMKIRRRMITSSPDITDSKMEVETIKPSRKRKEIPSPHQDEAGQAKNINKIRVIRSQAKSDVINLDNYQEKDTSLESTRKTGKEKIPIRDRLRPIVKETEFHKLESKNTEELVRNLTEWVEDADMIRVECSNGIHGKLNGNLRERMLAVMHGI